VKVLLLVNPYASGVNSKTNVRIRRALREKFDLAEKFTAERGHATELARAAAKEGIEVVFVLGGDGTLNEVANGLYGTRTAMAPLPGGSTNVFTRSLKLPANVVAATKQLIDLLENRQMTQIGLGCVNGRRFLFHTGVGFDAAVVKLVERKSDLKRWLRHPLYVMKATSAWFRHYDHKNNVLRIQVQEDVADMQVEDTAVGPMCLILNTNPYTYLGSRPLDITPDASLSRELVFVGLKSLSATSLLRLVRKALRGKGKLTQDKAVDYRPDMTSFALTSETSIPWQVDGDYCGEATHWVFSYEPRTLWLLKPQEQAAN